MNLRIRQTGGIVWFTPRMQVTYRPRPTLSTLAKQYYDYGRWRREVARRHPETLSLRYLAAPLAVLGIAFGLVLGLVGLVSGVGWLALLGFAAPAGYLLANLAASAQSAVAAPRLPWRSARLMPAVYATMHGAWGTGFLRGGAGS